MEVLIGASDEQETARLERFLSGFERIAIDGTVSQRATRIRREHRILLPNAIIWASAHSIGGMLVTRNTKDFSRRDPGVRVPYSIL